MCLKKMQNNIGKKSDHFKKKTSCQKVFLRENVLFRCFKAKENQIKGHNSLSILFKLKAWF